MKKEKQMTVPPGTDASFDLTRNWTAINWKAAQQQVRRLQVRIAKAVTKTPPRARTEAHRLERLEPDEGKLSRPVLRGGWAGDSLPLLD